MNTRGSVNIQSSGGAAGARELRRNAGRTAVVSVRMAESSRESLESLVQAAFGATELSSELIPLKGGLESAVGRVRFDQLTPDGCRVTRSAVIKRLEGFHRREADVYRLLDGTEYAPALLATVDRDDATYLFLEAVRPVIRWPWRDPDAARLVMRQLAALHTAGLSIQHAAWEYESALAVSAEETIRVVESASIAELPLGSWRTAVRRVAKALPALRLQLMDELGMTFIHGDAHPGNVILRERAAGRSVVFLDWTRSRVGSPLEDVASWLETLRYWEASAAQRHNSLLCDYLAARDIPALTRSLREAYWIACASNVMAGALRFHLLRANELTGTRRGTVVAQARDALRVIRRADAVLRRGARRGESGHRK